MMTFELIEYVIHLKHKNLKKTNGDHLKFGIS